MDGSCAWHADRSAPTADWKSCAMPPTRPGRRWRFTRRRSLNCPLRRSPTKGQRVADYFLKLQLAIEQQRIDLALFRLRPSCGIPRQSATKPVRSRLAHRTSKGHPPPSLTILGHPCELYLLLDIDTPPGSPLVGFSPAFRWGVGVLRLRRMTGTRCRGNTAPHPPV